MVTSYSDLNALPEIAFIAGSDKVLEFTAYSEAGAPLYLKGGGSIISWYLCHYGHPEHNVLYVAGVIIDDNTFSVTIPAEYTSSLDGLYTQQVTITDWTGTLHRPAQGTVIILPCIAH